MVQMDNQATIYLHEIEGANPVPVPEAHSCAHLLYP